MATLPQVVYHIWCTRRFVSIYPKVLTHLIKILEDSLTQNKVHDLKTALCVLSLTYSSAVQLLSDMKQKISVMKDAVDTHRVKIKSFQDVMNQKNARKKQLQNQVDSLKKLIASSTKAATATANQMLEEQYTRSNHMKDSGEGRRSPSMVLLCYVKCSERSPDWQS